MCVMSLEAAPRALVTIPSVAQPVLTFAEACAARRQLPHSLCVLLAHVEQSRLRAPDASAVEREEECHRCDVVGDARRHGFERRHPFIATPEGVATAKALWAVGVARGMAHQ